MFSDISKVRDYLYERNTSVFGLEAISALLEILGNPQNDLKFVHVTGTNGKGSTSEYIAEILIESGYRVGSFSSPAVFCENEIFKIDDEPISDDEYIHVFNIVYDGICKMEERGLRLPTKFEIETAMSFVYFKMKKTDIVVMEVGMGGELDSTNIVKTTIVEIITRISYDHMGILGSTLTEIATNKSGIIKKDTLVITTMQDSEVMRVLRDKCFKMGSKLVIAGDGTKISGDVKGQVIAYKGREYTTRLLGNYQRYNLPIAIECAKGLRRLGFDKISDNSIYNAVASAKLDGRFEVIGKDPIFVLDGAHNDEASMMLRESIKSYFEGRKIIFIVGIFKDKDYRKILDNTMDLAGEVITFDWDNPRHLEGEKLRDLASEYLSNVKYEKTISDAVDRALEDSSKGDVIVAFGSLSHLKEIEKAYKGVRNGRY